LLTDLDHIDAPPERFLKVKDQLAKVECGPADIHINEQVNVAVRMRLAPRD